MKKSILRFLFLPTLLLINFTVVARHITADEASVIAENFLSHKTNGKPKLNRASRSLPAVSERNETNDRYYVFNAANNKGFVIVADNDRDNPIIGFSDDGYFDFTNLPPQLSSLLANYSKNITDTSSNSSYTDLLYKSNIAEEIEDAILLKTANWGQDYPYNSDCPVIDGKQSMTGCVATAMAIVMKYNNWPPAIRDDEEIISWNNDFNSKIKFEYSIKGKTFNYPLMPDDVDSESITLEQQQEIAKLMASAGAAVRMNYDKESSGAWSAVTGHCLNYYFGYSNDCQYINFEYSNTDEWLDIIHNELNDARPVIISGRNDANVGHAFVCDGYTTSGDLHINWGWSGIANGYYSPFLLNGFGKDLYMTFNIKKNESQETPLSCWIGPNFRDTMDDASGLSVNLKDITNETPFLARVRNLNFTKTFSGDIGVALIDSKNNILEIIGSHHVDVLNDPNFDAENYDLLVNWLPCYDMTFACNKLSTPLTPDMQIAVIARENTEKWKFVNGTIQCPSAISLTNNKIPFVEIKINLHDPDKLITYVSILGYGKTGIYAPENEEINFGLFQGDNLLTFSREDNEINTEIFIGDVLNVSAHASNGLVYSFMNDYYMGNGGSICNFVAKNDKYIIDIFAVPIQNLIEKNITNPVAGALSSRISKDEQHLINKLTIKGEIDKRDLDYIISNLYSLEHLDLKDALIKEYQDCKENHLPSFAFRFDQDEFIGCGPTIRSIKLPNNLVAFDSYSDQGLFNDDVLEIPASVSNYATIYQGPEGFGSVDFEKVRLVKVNNPEPAELYKNDTHKFSTLVVPKGSKEKYESSPGWRYFSEIIEDDADIINEYTYDEDFEYVIVSDYAIVTRNLHNPIRGYLDDNTPLILPSEVIYNGCEYPVKYIGNKFAITYVVLADEEFYNLETLYTPTILFTASVKPNYSIINNPQRIYIPGGSLQNYFSNIAMFVEMWNNELSLDGKSVSFSPLPYISFEILSVKINNKPAIPVKNNIYTLDTPEEIEDLEIEYSLDGIINSMRPLTTHYTAKMISQFERTLFTDCIQESQQYKAETFNVFNMQGICVMKNAQQADMAKLPEGVYIVGNKKIKIRH